MTTKRKESDLLELVADPTGDFRRGAEFTRHGVAYGLRRPATKKMPEIPPVWADGTQFKAGRRVLTVRGGRLVNERGGLVVLVRALGR